MDALMRIGELASAAGVSPRTVDYYTSLDLLTPTQRTDGNFRLYDPAAVERIATIRRLESLGVPLDEIARALRSPHGADVGAVLRRLDHDLQVLQDVARTAGPEAHGLLAVVAARAHNLVSTAIEIALHLTPG